MHLGGVEFSYAVNLNYFAIRDQVAALRKSIEPGEDYEAFERERLELCKKHAKKDDKGKPMTIPIPGGIRYVFGDCVDLFEKQLTVLRKKHKSAIEAQEKREKDYAEILKQDFQFAVSMVKPEKCPKEITGAKMMAIWEMVEK